jgi:hypothetical protein
MLLSGDMLQLETCPRLALLSSQAFVNTQLTLRSLHCTDSVSIVGMKNACARADPAAVLVASMQVCSRALIA